ncbi:MAG: MFS transporter [Ramlibacter sp.]|nr:MFS transporter [Ramlibacter sp.]
MEHTARPEPMSVLSQAALLIMAACAATSVANVYYVQPLLDVVAQEFSISNAAVGGVITATQAGCALALLFVVPLGDLLNRKVLLCAELALLAFVLLVISVSSSPLLLLIGMAGLGLLGTAVTQGIIAYAATLSTPSERGRIIGTIQSGVLVGVLGARSLSGIVADIAGWRAVFVVSAGLAAVMLMVFVRSLPRLSLAPVKLRYSQLLASMFDLLASERVLQVRGVLGMMIFAAFGAFWSALVLPLRAEPYQLSHTAIGAFGFVGIAGALAAARAGRLADRGLGERTTFLALLCMVVAWAPIALLPHSLVVLCVGIVLLDLGGQAVHVINQSMIFKTRPEMHSRLVGCYMLFYAAGLGLGAIAATYTFSHAGWAGVCWLGLGISVSALIFWALTRNALTPAVARAAP